MAVWHLSVIRPQKFEHQNVQSFRRGAVISAILRNFGQVRHSRVIDALTGRTIDDQPGADVRKSQLWFQVRENSGTWRIVNAAEEFVADGFWWLLFCGDDLQYICTLYPLVN